MSVDIRQVDEGLADGDIPSAQIDVRYTGAADTGLHVTATVDPLLVVQMQRELAVVDSTLQEIADRSRRGEPTPVPVALVDTLGLRERLEELALKRFP
tara:strand:+ start:288 stop:581 length:294 start_codon:yes stop_codon:yes gene_type:complete